MKIMRIVLLIMFVCVSSLSAQQRYITKAGEILFEASVPSFEEVKATNNGVSAILNPETGEFAALALIKGFRFKVALMEEHFNENYIESSKYPKATFKGIIKGFKISEISAVKKEFRVKGTLNLHGVDKELELPLNVSQENGTMLLQLSFILKPEEFDIKIPKIVSSKIADEIEVTADFSLKK